MKSLINLSKHFFSGYFSLIASLASIIGLFIIFLPNKNQTIIALIAFIVFLLIILLRLFFVVKTFLLQKTEDGFHKFATYMRYYTNDGKHITYEAYKYIQCKTLIMDEHHHEFYWTGKSVPIIKSDIQRFMGTSKSTNGYEKATLKFITPLTYNDFAVVHLKMDLDDSGQISETHLEQRVKEKVQFINFRVELRHCKNKKDARVMRKVINSPGGYSIIDYVKFDTLNRSFEYSFPNPDAGYLYRLEWDR